jgi:hypothetical protein
MNKFVFVTLHLVCKPDIVYYYCLNCFNTITKPCKIARLNPLILREGNVEDIAALRTTFRGLQYQRFAQQNYR